jgi:hypothetical protein
MVISPLEISIISGIPGSQRIVGIVDWEEAGWYPEYWEYCKLLYEIEYTQEWRSAGWVVKMINHMMMSGLRSRSIPRG